MSYAANFLFYLISQSVCHPRACTRKISAAASLGIQRQTLSRPANCRDSTGAGEAQTARQNSLLGVIQADFYSPSFFSSLTRRVCS